MAYTVTQLISGAYYASGIVAREFETVGGGQSSDALIWLNDILEEKVVDNGMIPYEGSSTFASVAGQEEYLINDLIDIDTLTFVKNDVRYGCQFVKRNQYFGAVRAQNIESLSLTYHFERELGGARIYLYFLPDDAYTFTIKGTFRLSQVTLNQDLELTLDRFYITYLRYALADRICAEYSFDTPANVMKQLDKYTAFIDKKSRVLDLKLQKQSTLQNNKNTISYEWVNLGNGWLPN